MGTRRLARACAALLTLSALLAAEAPAPAPPLVVFPAADAGGGGGGRALLQLSAVQPDYVAYVSEQSNVTLLLAAPCTPSTALPAGPCAPSPLRAVLLPGNRSWLAGVTLLSPAAAVPPALPLLLGATASALAPSQCSASCFDVPGRTVARVTNASTARAVTLAVPALTLGSEGASGTLVYMLYDGATVAAPTNVTLRVTPLLLPALSRFRRWPLWAVWPEGGAAPVLDWWAPGAAAIATPNATQTPFLMQRVLAPEAPVPANATRLAPFPLAWGRNDAAQLGSGDAAPRRAPLLQTPLSGAGASALRFAAISASSGHALGLTADGRVWAWGQGADAALGQGPGAPASPTSAPLPVTGGGLGALVVTAVAAGGAHSLALTSGGAVYSWGDNSRGQLGRGDAPATPGRVPFPAGVAITALAAGRAHSLALAADGAVWAWGDNGAAQLGLAQCDGAADASAPGAVTCQHWGDADPRPMVAAPSRLAGFMARGDDVSVDATARPPLRFVPAAVIAAAGDSSFAIASAPAGALFAWGAHTAGLLGLGAAGSALAPEADVAPFPVRVAALEGVPLVALAASATSRHALGLGADGGVWAWGDNTRRQLGLNATAPAVVWAPERVQALAGINISALAAGGAHSLALSDLGEVFAWGSDAFGQCGVGPAPSAGYVLTRRGWLSPANFTAGAAVGAPALLDATPVVLPPPGAAGAADDDGLTPLQWAASAATARRRRSLLQAGAVAYPTQRAALSGGAFTSAASGMPGGGGAVAGFGSAAGHGIGSAGEWLAVVPLPALVAGAQQADWVAAGGASSFAVRRGCAPGTELQRGANGIGASVCVPCAPGYISAALSSLSCAQCPLGQASPGFGGTVCALCAAGSYRASVGNPNCTQCGIGTYLPFPGAADATQCLFCPPGSYGPAPGAAACLRCRAGTYTNQPRQSSCLTCGAGTYQPRVGASSQAQCIKCPRRVAALLHCLSHV